MLFSDRVNPYERGTVIDHMNGCGIDWDAPPSPDRIVSNSWHDEVLESCLRAAILGRPVLDQCVEDGIDQDAATVGYCLGLARICADASDAVVKLLLHANDVEPEQIRRSVERFRCVCRLLEAECRVVLASGCITEPHVAQVFESCATHAYEGEFASATFIEVWCEPDAASGALFGEFLYE